MTVEEILFSIASTNAGVTALIGAGAECRLYPNVVPQDTQMPAATYQIIVGVPEGVMNGAPVADGVRIQIRAQSSEGYDAARALSAAFERAFEDLDVTIAHGVGIRCISWNGSDFDEETKRYLDMKDYRFWTSR